jgi:predicted NBD/HSP70 family sugar kinase
MKRYEVGNSLLIRDLNLTSIFRLIYKYGPVSRKELVDNTGYSAGTISNHVKRLLEEGYVIETEKGHSTGGRKPIYLTVNPERGYIISIDIKVNQVKIYLFNLKLTVIEQKAFSIDKGNPQQVLKEILDRVNTVLKERKIKDNLFLGMGIAVPGLIDLEKKMLDFAPNLGWEQIDIIHPIQTKYPVPVILENEAKASAIGEREFIYPDVDNMVFVSVNEGIGCGIIFDGKLYRGASGNAGEYGHIIIDSDGPQCHCGNQGCWETLASQNYLINLSRKIKGKELTLEEIYRSGEEGDQEILEVFQELGNNLGIGLVNIVNSLSPELVVLGGDCIRNKKFIEDDMKRVLREEALDISYKKTEIEFSKLGDRAIAYGLARMVFDKVIEQELMDVTL